VLSTYKAIARPAKIAQGHRKNLEPAVSDFVRSLSPPEKIPLCEDANYSAFGIDYRQTAHARSDHQVRRRFKGRVGTRRNGRARHDIGNFHSHAHFGVEYGYP
jgi:hypothetical protein